MIHVLHTESVHLTPLIVFTEVHNHFTRCFMGIEDGLIAQIFIFFDFKGNYALIFTSDFNEIIKTTVIYETKLLH